VTRFKLLGPRIIVFEVLYGKKRDIIGIFIFRRFSNFFWFEDKQQKYF
jgi:hypothetical protein